MRTPHECYSKTPMIVYTCELDTCVHCTSGLVPWHYVSGPRTVQTLSGVLTVAQRAKHCGQEHCAGYQEVFPSVRWRHLAPPRCGYGFDVIARVGWERQTQRERFATIHAHLAQQVEISETHVRYLYHQQYLPLLACHERHYRAQLEAVGRTGGLLLSLDGLMPEGGEPQLWLVRELRTALTLRSGWMSAQDEEAFVNFLQPIADLGLPIPAVLSDKQKGLLPAVARVFPHSRHAFCQLHYLKNAAAPLAQADEAMKVTLRKSVRAAVGALVRQEQAEKAGVLTVTGLLPSPAEVAPGSAGATPFAAQPAGGPLTAEREHIVQDLLRRVRYLLTLKGRPPFRLAGLEMYDRLQEVAACLNRLLRHHPDERLARLRDGLRQALRLARPDYAELQMAAEWLHAIAALLEPEGQPARTGADVRAAVETYLQQIAAEAAGSPRLQACYATLVAVTHSYAPGLYDTYDVRGLPRTNNARESEFRELQRRLLATTGQKGLVRRLLQREGAWELIPRPASFAETVRALSQVQPDELAQERQRVRTHRERFRLHTRSAKQAHAQLKRLEQRWRALPGANSP